MNFFAIKTAVGVIASRSRTVRRLAGQQVRQRKQGFVPSLLGVSGRAAQQRLRNAR